MSGSATYAEWIAVDWGGGEREIVAADDEGADRQEVRDAVAHVGVGHVGGGLAVLLEVAGASAQE